MAVIYNEVNIIVHRCITNLATHFPDIQELQEEKKFVAKNFHSKNEKEASVIFDKLTTGLTDDIVQKIHKKDMSVFTERNCGLINFFHPDKLLPRLNPSEVNVLWTELKQIVTQTATANYLHPVKDIISNMTTSFAHQFEDCKKHNKPLPTQAELQQSILQRIISDAELRSATCDAMLGKMGKDENGNVIRTPGMLGGIEKLMNAFGVPSAHLSTQLQAETEVQAEDEAEDQQEEEEEESATKQTLEVNHNEASQASASSLYKSANARNRRRRLARRRKKAEEGEKKTTSTSQQPLNVSDMFKSAVGSPEELEAMKTEIVQSFETGEFAQFAAQLNSNNPAALFEHVTKTLRKEQKSPPPHSSPKKQQNSTDCKKEKLDFAKKNSETASERQQKCEETTLHKQQESGEHKSRATPIIVPQLLSAFLQQAQQTLNTFQSVNNEEKKPVLLSKKEKTIDTTATEEVNAKKTEEEHPSTTTTEEHPLRDAILDGLSSQFIATCDHIETSSKEAENLTTQCKEKESTVATTVTTEVTEENLVSTQKGC